VSTVQQASQAVAYGAAQSYYQSYAVAAAKRAAQKYGLDANRMAQVYYRLINQESGFDPDAYNSSSGASGIAQIMPNFHPGVDPFNPEKALDYGADFLGSMISRYGGDFLRGTAAYNFGPGNVDRLAGLDNNNFVMNLPQETQTYVKNILGTIKPPDTGAGDMGAGGQEQEDPFGGTTTGGSNKQVKEVGGQFFIFDPNTGDWTDISGNPVGEGHLRRALEGERMRETREATAKTQAEFEMELMLNSLPPTPYQQAQLGLEGGRLGLSQQQFGLDQQQFQQSIQENAMNRQLQAIEEARMLQTLAEQTRQNQRETLIEAGPSMTAGREYYGGFQPGGAASGIANFAGVGFTPQSTANAQVPLDVSAQPAQANPQLMALLNRYLNGG
jgi:hypothetical protein